MIICGVFGLLVIVAEVFSLRKAERMEAADFPSLSREQLEDKRGYMKTSAYLLIGAFVMYLVLGNLMILAGHLELAQVLVFPFLVLVIASAVFGTKASELK